MTGESNCSDLSVVVTGDVSCDGREGGMTSLIENEMKFKAESREKLSTSLIGLFLPREKVLL